MSSPIYISQFFSNFIPTSRKILIFAPPIIISGYFIFRGLTAKSKTIPNSEKSEKDHNPISPSDSTDFTVSASSSNILSSLKGDTIEGISLSILQNGSVAKTKCSTCKNMQKLSFRDVNVNETSIKNFSSGQLIKYTYEQLNNVIKAIEELRGKAQNLKGDEGSQPEEKLDKIFEELNQIQFEFELFRENYMPATYRKPMVTYDVENEEEFDDTASFLSTATTGSLGYWDPEPNLHFFEIYQEQLKNIASIIVPRTDRTNSTGCDSRNDWLAKVQCIRIAFEHLFSRPDVRERFTKIGEEFLKVILDHNLRDTNECISAYYSFLDYVANPDNLETIEKELNHRNIRVVSFYDIVLDYMILESFDDLENPPSAVKSVMTNRWLSCSFRELSLQTAVSAVMRRKRGKLIVLNGFFAHFYSILDHLSPLMAWGFLGTDENLNFKCRSMKDSATDLIRDFFSFDRCRFTSYEDLCDDIVRVTEERYWELNNKLTIVND